MKKMVCLFLVLCFMSGCGSKKSDLESTVQYHTITSEAVFKEIESNHDSDFYIVDVRTEAEYTMGHIETAVNIPLVSIDMIDRYGFNKDAKIVVYCQSGARSRQAAEKLIDLGYQNVFDLGGIQDWDYDLVQ